MTEKAIEKVKQVSAKVAEAVARSSYDIGAADALAAAGLALLGLSAWLHHRSKQ